jgi:hypothetical protein
VLEHLAWMSRLLARPRLHLRGLESCAQSLTLYLNELSDAQDGGQVRAALQAFFECQLVLAAANRHADFVLHWLNGWIEDHRGRAGT